MPHFSVPRPALAFRIGVSGARTLSAEQIDALRAPVAEILGLVRDEIAGLAATDVAKSAYRQEGDEAPVCALSIVSPLAEGADRIVAEEGGKIGAELRVPLPFEKAQFEQDFPKTVDAFRKLLEVASVLTLDGDRADAFRDDSYVENGRFVVRNCDLLIAIWDGEKEKGRGGAGEIVRFAANMGLPVWWIDKANVAKPRFILRSAHLNAPDRAPSADQARDALRFYLRQSILPPKALPPERNVSTTMRQPVC